MDKKNHNIIIAKYICLFVLFFITCLALVSCSAEDSLANAQSSSSSIVDYTYISENGTNYLPILTERWTNYKHAEAINVLTWKGPSSSVSISTVSTPFEGDEAWQVNFNNNSEWWGFGKSFVTETGSYDCKRINMLRYWNWNLTFTIKGPATLANNVMIAIQSGIYGKSDLRKYSWLLADLGYTGSGAWETINIPLSEATNIDWKSLSYLFMLYNKDSTPLNANFLIDDIYLWVKAEDHGKINPTPGPFDTPKAINTNTDPAYQITYQNTKFVPPDGKVLLIAGQDRTSIPGYIASMGHAGGYSSYIAICDTNGITNNYVGTDNIRTNIQNVKWLSDSYPNTVAHVAIWLVGKALFGKDYCQNTTNGMYNAVIDTISSWAISANIPVYMRIGYEFDGVHNMLDPDDYKNAYRYIVDRMRANGANNIAYVWHSYASTPYNGNSIADWYPGDSYVDWVGVSIFNGQVLSETGSTELNHVIDLAKSYKKPVMAAETTPNTGIVANNYSTWNSWFVNFFNYVYKKNIKAICYINCDWNKVSIQTPEWGNTQIQDFPLIKAEWLKEINKPRYLKQSSTLFTELGM